MMDLSISEDELKAWLACEFCGQTIEWPFASTTLAAGNDPDIEQGVNHIIVSHFSTGKTLDNLDFEECPHTERWKNTTWRRIDVDDGDKVLSSGKMVMENGFRRQRSKTPPFRAAFCSRYITRIPLLISAILCIAVNRIWSLHQRDLCCWSSLISEPASFTATGSEMYRPFLQ